MCWSILMTTLYKNLGKIFAVLLSKLHVFLLQLAVAWLRNFALAFHRLDVKSSLFHKLFLFATPLCSFSKSLFVITGVITTSPGANYPRCGTDGINNAESTTNNAAINCRIQDVNVDCSVANI